MDLLLLEGQVVEEDHHSEKEGEVDRLKVEAEGVDPQKVVGVL